MATASAQKLLDSLDQKVEGLKEAVKALTEATQRPSQSENNSGSQTVTPQPQPNGSTE